MNRLPPFLLGLLASALVVGFGALYFLIVALPPAERAGEMHLWDFGKVPVEDHGRVKPFDTLARTSLMIISSRQTFTDESGKEQPAVKWLLDVMSSDQSFEQRRVFSIQDPELAKLLGLPARADGRYALQDFPREVAEKLVEIADHSEELESRLPGEGGREVLALARQLAFYARFSRFDTPHKVFRIENDQVLSLMGLQPRSGLRYSFGELAPKVPKLIEEAARVHKLDEKTLDVYDSKVLELYKHVELYIGLARLEADTELVVPPQAPGQEWQTFPQALRQQRPTAGAPAPADQLDHILLAYARGDAQEFNTELASYRGWLAGQMPHRVRMAALENFFNHVEPFYQCLLLYVVVILLALAAWVLGALFEGIKAPLGWSAFSLAVLVLAVHSGALLTRMILQGRPPVTNLYSSAVWIGWGGVGLGLLLEVIFRNGIGNTLAGVLGFLTMLIAHHLAFGGDTMPMLEAVLDTNFWLATHVTCVTFGYTATFLAGFAGILFIILGVMTPALDRDLFKALGQIIYGIVCFATLLSFTGTVLGGIWADQSWGRFWGWDPKENGALLIVLWNALILHARWGGMVKQRGTAVLAVVGNMITAWSWFGTNQLGVGLHSYGFNSTLSRWLVAFWFSQLVFVIIGLLPTSLWWSFGAQKASVTSGGKRPARRPGLASG